MRTDDSAEDFRSKMVEAHVLARLFGMFQEPSLEVRQSSIDVITASAKFGGLTNYLVLCEG